MFDKYGLFFYLYGIRQGVDFDRLDVRLPKRNDEADAVSIDKNKNSIPTGTRGYRYFGYSENGAVVSNTYHPPDVPPSK